MEVYKIDKDKIKIHNIVYAITSKPDYNMDRLLLLENLEDLKYDEFVIVEGGHCSCYDFDDTKWEGTKYTKEELLKLAEANINKDSWYGIEKNLYNYILKNIK